MYKQIENEFKNKSRERRYYTVFVIISIIVASIAAVPIAKVDAPIWSSFAVGSGEGDVSKHKEKE